MIVDVAAPFSTSRQAAQATSEFRGSMALATVDGALHHPPKLNQVLRANMP